MLRLVVSAGLITAALGYSVAQMQFEAASLKLSVSPPRKGRITGGPGTDDPGRISVDGFHLRRLLLSLHNLRDDQLRAPDWMRDVQVDIVAKVPPGVTSVQARQMLAKLIEERFQMKLH